MGRPSKLTPEVQESICRTLSAGVDLDTACRREGIGRSTVYDWIERGKKDEEPYASFLLAVDKAQADVETGVTFQVIKASKTQWQAGAWWLKFKATRGATRIELTGRDGAPLSKGGQLSEQAVDQIRRRILYGEARSELPAGRPVPELVEGEVEP